MHYLESGWQHTKLLVLLHGYPELAYSWRRMMEPLAEAGFHVVAMDHRGAGRTTGWDSSYDTTELSKFSTSYMASDTLALVKSLGYEKAEAVLGHDFGSGLAVECASQFPHVFTSLVHMSAPHGTASIYPDNLQLGFLSPPRKHYWNYYSTREANGDMMNSAQGLHDFLRGYSHFKSGDWKGTTGPDGNMPHTLDASLGQKVFAELPHYYVMLKNETMAEGVAHEMPSAEEIAAKSSKWLPESELAVYVEEFGRTGFQGGLNWYRPKLGSERIAAKISVPTAFMAGGADWGVYQLPGAFESMPLSFSDWRGAFLIPGAGHWVTQEAADELTETVLQFLHNVSASHVVV